jgi:hypothetical protein
MKNLIDKSMGEHRVQIRDFCKKYNVRLKKIDTTEERGHQEPVYAFSDNLGYYTIDGIKKSL